MFSCVLLYVQYHTMIRHNVSLANHKLQVLNTTATAFRHCTCTLVSHTSCYNKL